MPALSSRIFSIVLKVSKSWRLKTHSIKEIKIKELIKEFCKVAEYKINIHKLIGFQYTSKEISETEIKKNNSINYIIKNTLKVNPNKGSKRSV